MITGGGHDDNVSPETKKVGIPSLAPIAGFGGSFPMPEWERAALHHPVFLLQPHGSQMRQEAPAASRGESQAELFPLRFFRAHIQQ